MLDSIDYILPGGPYSEAAIDLQNLLVGSNAEMRGNSLIVSTSPDLMPVTRFRFNERGRSTKLQFTDKQRPIPTDLPSGFFSSHVSTAPAISFADAARELAGLVKRVDHTGLVVRPQNVAAKDWSDAVYTLCSQTLCFDYPENQHGYDSARARWLFAIPTTPEEGVNKRPSAIRLRQPKFELVCDVDAPDATVLQIDMETSLTAAEIKKAFPSSFQIPGLEEAFHSVNVVSPWNGISHVRLDLRPQGAVEEDWTNGQFLIENGQFLRMSNRQSNLPQLKNS